jgi:hypothetical protein
MYATLSSSEVLVDMIISRSERLKPGAGKSRLK